MTDCHDIETDTPSPRESAYPMLDQIIETTRTLSINLDDFDLGGEDQELVIETRITWSVGMGMEAEALRYWFGGTEYKVSAAAISQDVMDKFVIHTMENIITPEYLAARLAHDPLFEPARRHEWAEGVSDRRAYPSSVI